MLFFDKYFYKNMGKIMENKTFFLQELYLSELDAYHGSPYDFDQFDVRFIGSGEGGQAHGWGLYFALNNNIAKKYQKTNSIANTKSTVSYSIDNKIYKKGTVMFSALDIFKKEGKTKAIKKIESLLTNDNYNESDKIKISNILKIIKKLNKQNISKKVELIKGQIYYVDIPELGFYLNENLKISEQTKYIKANIKKLCIDKKINRKILSMLGKEFYSFLKSSYCNNDNKETSLLLLKYNIKGLYYKGKDDLDCVTIFNHNDIRIINKEYETTDSDVLLPSEERIEQNPKLISKIENPNEKLQLICISNDPLAIKYIKNPSQKIIDKAFEKDCRIIAYNLIPSMNKIMETLNKDNYAFNDIYKFLNKENIINICQTNPRCVLYSYTSNNYLPEDYVLLALKSVKSESDLPPEISVNNKNIFAEILDNMFKSKFYDFIYASYRNVNINNIQNIDHRNKLLFILWEKFIPLVNTLYKSDIDVLHKRIKLNNNYYIFKNNHLNIKNSCYLNNETISEIIKIAIDLYDNDYLIDLTNIIDRFNNSQKEYLYSHCPDYNHQHKKTYTRNPIPNNMNIFKYIQ